MTELIPMKLKPCPFCYGQAELVTFEDRDSGGRFVEYFVQCSKCRASGPLGGPLEGGKKLAVKAWSRRARKPLDKSDGF